MEVYEEVNLTKVIAGGVIGGLLLLALITAALYKVCILDVQSTYLEFISFGVVMHMLFFSFRLVSSKAITSRC